MNQLYSIEAEQACLGSCLIDSMAFDRVSEIIAGPEDFYREEHQVIYGAMLYLVSRNSNIDILTVGQYLKDQHKLELCGGAQFLDSLISMVASSAHVGEYAKIVADKAIERRLQQAGNDIVRLAFNTQEETAYKVDLAEEMVFAVGDKSQKVDLMPLRDSIFTVEEHLRESYDQHQTVTGVPTGFEEIDLITSGFQPSNLIVIGARPSMGKTAFALSLALRVAVKAKRGAVAVFSLEMSREEICQRLLCSMAQVNNVDIRNGDVRDGDWQRIANAADELGKAPIYIDEQSSTTVLEMKSKLRRLKKKEESELGLSGQKGLAMVIIDYLQLIHGGTSKNGSAGSNRVQELSEITRQLKGLAKELKVPVVALSQLSRNLENRQDKRPIMADLRESGSIEQDADLIMFLYRDKYYNPQSEAGDKTEIILAKHRNGPIGTIELVFQQKFGSFHSVEQSLNPGYEDMNPEMF
ncbi:replicative DNA helicase [bacterium]|nr:replicative DNA helicase [bacterium]